MITGYFGIPRSGKTTTLTKIAIDEQKRIIPKYERILTINFECSGCQKITWKDLATYKIYNALILIDEISLEADNREFKSFMKEHRDFFVLHGHFGLDIIWSTQDYEKVDKTIRQTTAELWYMSKSVVPILNQITRCRRIYRNININEHTSELTMGYRFCNMIEGFFVSNNKFIYRRPLYKYFNSFDELTLKDRPELPQQEETKVPKLSTLYINKKIKEKIWKKKELKE